MLVGDLICNNEFDINCAYEVYDCSNGKDWQDGAELLFSTRRDGYSKPLDKVLDMRIGYITINNNSIIIEAVK